MDTFAMFEQIDELTNVPAEVWDEFFTESEYQEQ